MTTTTKKARGTCSHCGQMVALRMGWFDTVIVEFHGQVRGKGGRGIAGRCPGSRLPTKEVGPERLAAYVKANEERVVSYSKPAA